MDKNSVSFLNKKKKIAGKLVWYKRNIALYCCYWIINFRLVKGTPSQHPVADRLIITAHP